MLRTILAATLVALGASAASASSYSATLAAPNSERFVTRDIVWNCGPAACQGATEESRPLVLCQSLAKRAGRIDTFLVNGRALPPAELERCNASARALPAKELAAH